MAVMDVHEWLNHPAARPRAVPQDTMRVTVTGVRRGIGRFRTVYEASIDNILSRWNSQAAKDDPDWFWINITNEEHKALINSGTMPAEAVQEKYNEYFAGNGTRYYAYDDAVSDWRDSGYQKPWE